MTRYFEVIALYTAQGQEHSGQVFGVLSNRKQQLWQMFVTSFDVVVVVVGGRGGLDDVTEAAKFTMTNGKTRTE